jgi:hypothetical protein
MTCGIYSRTKGNASDFRSTASKLCNTLARNCNFRCPVAGLYRDPSTCCDKVGSNAFHDLLEDV